MLFGSESSKGFSFPTLISDRQRKMEEHHGDGKFIAWSECTIHGGDVVGWRRKGSKKFCELMDSHKTRTQSGLVGRRRTNTGLTCHGIDRTEWEVGGRHNPQELQ